MHWPTLTITSAFAVLTLPHRISAAPVALLGGLTGDDPSSPSIPNKDGSSSTYTESKPYAYHTCPNGGTWTRFEDDFTTFNDGEWVIETGATGVSTDKRGMTLTLDPDMSHTGGIVIASRHHWRAPLKVQVEMKTSGAGGIVNAFIFKAEGKTGDEIDLEVAGDTFQLPLWKSGVRLKKNGSGKDAKQDLRHETIEDPASEYHYHYPGYEPTAWQGYELAWEPDLVLWTVDDVERVQFLRKSDRFPSGPLPIRFGPWSTAEDQDWAGKLDWSQNPHPKMQVRNFVVEGCRVD